MEFDIYDRKKRKESLLRKLHDSGISGTDKDLILGFIKFKTDEEQIEISTVSRYLCTLRILSENLQGSFVDLTKDKVKSLLETICNRSVKRGSGELKPMTVANKYNYAHGLKIFLVWMKKEGYPVDPDWVMVPAHPKIRRRLGTDEILTWEDIVLLSSSAMNPRDRAIIQVLFDSGLRIEELLTLLIKDVEFVHNGNGVVLHLRKSKTVVRNVGIVRSAPALIDWLNLHPKKLQVDGPLFVNLSYPHSFMSYNSVNKALRDVRNRSVLDKPVNPHTFRKSAASHCAHMLTESESKERFGWVQSSKMLDIYVHPNETRVNNRFMELEGVVEAGVKPQQEVAIKPQTCMWCNKVNPLGVAYCLQCKRPLSEQKNPARSEIELTFKCLVGFMEQNPDVLNKFTLFMKNELGHLNAKV